MCRLRAPVAAGLLALASGCVFTARALDLGTKRAWVTRVTQARRDGDRILMTLDLSCYVRADLTEHEYSRHCEEVGWAEARIDALDWGDAGQLSQRPRSHSLLVPFHLGPPPEVPTMAEEVPAGVPSHEAWSDGATACAELRSLIETHSMAVLVRESAGVIARADPGLPCNMSTASIDFPREKEQLTWWAIPARVAIVPFTLAIEAVIVPPMVIWVETHGGFH